MNYAMAAPYVPPELRDMAHEMPRDVDLIEHKSAELIRTFSRSVVLPCFSMPFQKKSDESNVALMSGKELVGVEVHESLHRFDVRVEPPRGGRGHHPINQIGRQVASIHVTWRPIPEDYVAHPGVEPPPMPFDPTRSQRFIMDDGHFVFKDKNRSGFHGFAAGRTFPSVVGGKPQIRLGAVVDILESSGAFAGLPGVVAVDGIIDPPSSMALAITPLFVDYNGHLLTRSALPPLRPEAEPDDEALFLTFVARGGPSDPTPILPTDNEMMLAFAPRLPICLAHMSFDFRGPYDLESRRTVGQNVGDAQATFWMGPFAGGFPVPFQSRGGRLAFYDSLGEEIGAVDADIAEGRGLPLAVPGFPFPVLRGAGVAPINRGEGIFEGASGLVVVNGLFSLFPRVNFCVYILRLSDADQRIRRAIRGAWT